MKKLLLMLIMILMSMQLIFADLQIDRELDNMSFDKGAQKSSIAAFKVGIEKFIFERPYEKGGSKALEVEYRNGKREGNSKFYHPNGNILLKGNNKNAKQIGTWEFYDKKGKVKYQGKYEDIEDKFISEFRENMQKTLKNN